MKINWINFIAKLKINITCASLLLWLFLIIWIGCNTIYDMVHVFWVFLSKIWRICIFSVIAYELSKCSIIFAWQFHVKCFVLYAQQEKLESSFFALATMRSRVSRVHVALNKRRKKPVKIAKMMEVSEKIGN